MIRKLTVFLAAVVVSMGLLLGASTTRAATVILDGNNVIRIENLEVINQLEEVTVYDVDFVYDTGIGVYGSGFDFTFTQEEDGLLALEAVNNALNANNPTPLGAGPLGTDQFFIGVEEDDGFIAAVGGEKFAVEWGACDRDCFRGVGAAILASNAPFTYADFTLASDPDPDSDNDGLTDDLENTTCTDPNDADTDDDGILDGTEDSNRNGIVDSGEADPCNIDTDGDGIQDGTEVGYFLANIGSDTNTSIFQPDLDPTTTTDPLNSDTDGDGFTDGQEDSNQNGRVDSGETDPNDPNPSPVASFTSAATNSVLANLYSASTITYGVFASNDPSYMSLVQLYASTAFDYAEDAYNDASAALAAAGQDSTFWGFYAVQYAESDMNNKADALLYFDLAVQAYQAGDLDTAGTYLDKGFLSTSLAIVDNGNTIWTASTESAVATK